MANRRMEDASRSVAAAWEDSSLGRWAAHRPHLSLVLGCALAAWLVTVWLLLQAPNFFLGYDFLRMHSLYQGYLRQAVLGGHFPLWNPYIGLGRPFMADMETATLYPPSYLMIPFGVTGGVAVSVILHMTIAIYGGVRFGRVLGCSRGASALIGIGLVLSGPLSARLSAGIMDGFFSLCWWPVLLWLGCTLQDRSSRGGAVAFGAAVALAILAGNPPLLFVEFLGLVVFIGIRQQWMDRAALGRALGLAVAAVLGVGLAAVQLLPFLELVHLGNRPTHDPGFATASGMLPLSWPFVFVPATGTLDPNWEQNLHCGLIPFLAAVGGIFLWRDRSARALLGLGLLGGVMAAGDHTPVLGWLSKVVPGVVALRLPSRYGLWCATAVMALAAMVLSRPQRKPAASLAVGLILICWGVWALAPHASAGPARFAALELAAAVAAAALVWMWARRPPQSPHGGTLALLLGLFCAADGLIALQLQAPLYSEESFSSFEGSAHDLLAAKGLLAPGLPPPRISFSPADIRENAGMEQGFSTYNSYANPNLARTWNYLHAATGAERSSVDFIQLPVVIYRRVARLDSVNLAAVVDHERRTMVFLRKMDPRAYLAYRTRAVSSWSEAEERMAGDTGFHDAPFVEPGFPGLAATGTGFGPAAITSFAPGEIRLSVDAARPAVLVLGEAWYPGWTATVDGRPSKVYPVNGWMRGTLVPAGGHDVAFTFHQDYLAIGLLLTAASACALAALGLRGPRDQAVSSSL
jgi:hypothetical protein